MELIYRRELSGVQGLRIAVSILKCATDTMCEPCGTVVSADRFAHF